MNKYMMATKAYHKLGDISSDTPDLCIVDDCDDNNYIGNWVYGYGFIDVKFPKETTRELTPEEVEEYHGSLYYIGGSLMGAINLKNEDFNSRVCLRKDGTDKVYHGKLVAPVRIGGQIAMFRDDGQTFTTSKIQSIDGNRVTTKNSVYILEYL